MPRVLQVVLSLNPGGTERLVVELTRRLHPDAPMRVCCLDDRGTWARELVDRGIPVTELNRRPGFRPTLAQRLADEIREHRATVVHAHHYSPFVYAAMARAWKPRTRVVFTEHGRLSDAPPSPKRRLANQVLARFSSATFVVSADLKRHLVAEGFNPRDVGVIYNGIDVGPLPDGSTREEVRRALGVRPDVVVVGTVARLDPVKSLETLIQAVSRADATSPLALVVIGDGPERRRLEQVAATAGPPHLVHFLGHREDARRWLAGCDIFANSSISEGVSLTILEAMAAGLPVLATGVGGTPEVIDDSCGRLVPARNADALAEVLTVLATAPDLRTSLGRAARRRVEDRFTLERMVSAYRQVYEQLA